MPPPTRKGARDVLKRKMRRVSICGATETLLADRRAKAMAAGNLAESEKAGCELRRRPRR